MKKTLELAKKVLNENNNPMTSSEIYEYAVINHPNDVNNTFNGVTPIHTLGAALYVDSKKADTIFSKYKDGNSAVKFGLKGKTYNLQIQQILTDASQSTNTSGDFKEIDLHKYLVSYMSDICYCKTIDARKSDNNTRDRNTWIHPDIIGVRFLKEQYFGFPIKIMKINNENLFELYSFEMKLSITLSNANDEYLQAATNSSWANYGYIVTKDIDKDNKELMDKLKRLNRTFGIGVIKINVKTYSESEILFDAEKKDIDYDYINELKNLNNKDIDDFFKELIGICEDPRTDVASTFFDNSFATDVEGADYAKSKGITFN